MSFVLKGKKLSDLLCRGTNKKFKLNFLKYEHVYAHPRLVITIKSNEMYKYDWFFTCVIKGIWNL